MCEKNMKLSNKDVGKVQLRRLTIMPNTLPLMIFQNIILLLTLYTRFVPILCFALRSCSISIHTTYPTLLCTLSDLFAP